MSDVVIRAEGLGKKYVIGHETVDRNATFRDTLVNYARGLGRSAADMLRGRALITGAEKEEFWALRDVDFEIRRGDVVGIIGRNGAGKSTLLKILSRITEPTEGRVTIDGRVASLLEVGTGFHPELTGRENIYLNGAILGMTRAEIKRKFDEIVDFAGVEKFLDTPVKRYSSGMYVRLAFSVAAHLEPEILVVDEVLAVGDAEFQKKCLGKMQDVAGQGRTVLFVSHNMAAIQALCESAIFLQKGNLIDSGNTIKIIDKYTEKRKNKLNFLSLSDYQKNNFNKIVFQSFSIFELKNNDEYIKINIRYLVKEEITQLRIGIIVTNHRGEEVFEAYDTDCPATPRKNSRGYYRTEVRIPISILGYGQYMIYLNCGVPGDINICHTEEALICEIPQKYVDNLSSYPRRGVCHPELEWERVLEQ